MRFIKPCKRLIHFENFLNTLPKVQKITCTESCTTNKDWKRLVQNYRRKWTQHRRCFTSGERRHESEVANRSWPVRCFRLLSQKHPDKRMWCFTTRVQNALGAETQPRLTASHAKQQQQRLRKNLVTLQELHYIHVRASKSYLFLASAVGCSQCRERLLDGVGRRRCSRCVW